MTPRDLRNIHTTGNNCKDALPHEHDTKTTPAFLPADGEASWSLLPSSSPYYQVAQCNQKTPIPVSSRLQVRPEKAKKG